MTELEIKLCISDLAIKIHDLTEVSSLKEQRERVDRIMEIQDLVQQFLERKKKYEQYS